MESEIPQKRIDGRRDEQLRRIEITPGVNRYAEGSARVTYGNTELLISASVENAAPRWIEDPNMGWVTAEYGMLPRSTHTRMKREAASGRQGGRTLEIQRLIGRSLRAAVDLKTLGPLTIQIDCDVTCADGGTRTAAISGGWVALHCAIEELKKQGICSADVELHPIAAVSVGMFAGRALLDLCYEEDSAADFDLNLVFNGRAELVEIQGTAEGTTISDQQLASLVALGKQGAGRIMEIQAQAVA